MVRFSKGDKVVADDYPDEPGTVTATNRDGSVDVEFAHGETSTFPENYGMRKV